MNFRFLCTCGYTLISHDSDLREVICPDCEKPLTPDGISSADGDNPKPKHGLWQLMHGRETDTNDAQSEKSNVPEGREKSPFYKSLWETMKVEPEISSEQNATEIGEKREPAASASEASQEEAQLHDVEDDIVKLDEESISETEPLRRSSASYKRKPAPHTAIVGSIVGTVAILVSPLGMLDHFLYKFPATLIALVGLIFSLQAWNDLARSRERRKGTRLASYGVICGVLGMLLGPTLFSWWGNRLRDKTGHIETESHLERIGIALDLYHSQNNRFPIGGTYKRVDGQARTPMHGWMTALLPYMENHEQQVYRNIDFNLQYDHPKNRKAMSTEIPNFYAAGSSRKKLNEKFAVTHFSGVGSLDESKGTNIGIFHRDIAISRSDIRDGLSNTLAVGEIAHFFPAWGSPDNWRTIRDGLNKDRMGFGNATRTGAMFLHADGSVKFYSNRTPVEVLRKLSTRDGRE